MHRFSLTLLLSMVSMSSIFAQPFPGDLDPSFGNGGWYELPGGVLPNGNVTNLHVDVDNAILVVGWASDTRGFFPDGSRCFVTRVLETGQLDVTYGFQGTVHFFPSVDNSTAGQFCKSILLADGSLIVAGAPLSDPGGRNPGKVIKLRSDGSPDDAFAPNGIYELPWSGTGLMGPISLSLTSSGEVIIVGEKYERDINFHYRRSGEKRLWSLGSANPAMPGRVSSLPSAVADAMHERPDGQFDGLDRIKAILHRSSASLLDTTMLSSLAPSDNPVLAANGLVRRPDRRIITALSQTRLGSENIQYIREFVLGQWGVNGQPDEFFQSGPNALPGQSRISLQSLGYRSFTASSEVALHPGGRSIQVTTAYGAQSLALKSGVLIARGPFGGGQQNFGLGGAVLLDYPPGSQTEFGAIAVDRNGDIVVGGYSSVENFWRPIVARVLGDDDWTATWDTNPDSVNLPSVQQAPRNAWVQSGVFQVSGLGTDIDVPAFATNGEFQINGGAWLRGTAWVENGDDIRLRHRTPASGSQITETHLHMGGVRDPRNTRNLIGDGQIVVFQSTTAEPLPGLQCSAGALCDNNQAIPDNSPSTPAVAFLNQIGACPFVRSIRVGLNISHTYVGDLQVILDPPNTAPFSLINRPNAAAGNCSANDILATFELGDFPQAQTQCGQLGAGLRAIDGTVRPALGFPQVIGSNGQGAWSLEVRDYAGSDVGTLNDWSLELDCSNQPLNLADLEVTTTQPANLFAGEGRIWTISVTNNGPARAEFARFFGEVDRSVVSGLPELNPSSWSCSAPAGSSCLLPPGCTGTFCGGTSFSPGLDLAPGATATIELLAAPDALTPLGNEVGFSASAENLLAFDGAVDPDPGNNSIDYRRDVLVAQDLGITDARAIVIGNEVEVSFRIANEGPSAEMRSAKVDVQMPSGYVAATRSECFRGTAPCSGRFSVLVNQPPQWNYDDFVLVPGATPERLVFRAAFSGASAPSGPIQVEISGAVNEQDASDNAVSLTPTVITDAIFSDRFQ